MNKKQKFINTFIFVHISLNFCFAVEFSFGSDTPDTSSSLCGSGFAVPSNPITEEQRVQIRHRLQRIYPRARNMSDSELDQSMDLALRQLSYNSLLLGTFKKGSPNPPDPQSSVFEVIQEEMNRPELRRTEPPNLDWYDRHEGEEKDRR